MLWVGVRYRGIALPDIMNVMRIWLDQRRFNPNSFEVAISGSGTLVCVEFPQEAEAAEFAEAVRRFNITGASALTVQASIGGQ